jgi:hypothetical protein
MPEWTGRSSARTVTYTSAMPRSDQVSDGHPTFQFTRSVSTIASAASSSAWAVRNSPRWGEPISSSPSMMTLTLQGSSPRAVVHARIAATWARIPALSSAVPRP